MAISILVFPGTNREFDLAYALKEVGGRESVFVNAEETALPNGTEAVFLPGGFSHGDYLRSGAMAARSPIMQAVHDFAAKGSLVVGICNGFQILTEAGLLAGALMTNSGLKFQCRHIHLSVPEGSNWKAVNQGNIPHPKHSLHVPIAHNDGRYVVSSEMAKKLADNGQILLKYADSSGSTQAIHNANGSVDNIAGVCNEGGNVIGFMPHPENAVFDHHHSQDGRILLSMILEQAA